MSPLESAAAAAGLAVGAAAGLDFSKFPNLTSCCVNIAFMDLFSASAFVKRSKSVFSSAVSLSKLFGN